ncbi:MAG: hypothetical protein QNJ55_29985 [Xenococcus sp. MO_188.B8]|nr:hypothetical protein [Xenococcus sp. MO_188.B8]
MRPSTAFSIYTAVSGTAIFTFNDGALYLSNGNGTSFNVANPRTVRVQDIDTLSGKILRIDPTTGEPKLFKNPMTIFTLSNCLMELSVVASLKFQLMS